MKVHLVFKLPEEQDEYQSCMDGSRYKILVEDLDNKLRALSKYQDIESVPVDDVRAMIRDLKSDLGLTRD